MAENFQPGDNLVFQVESGFGLLRLLAVDNAEAQTVWHLSAYDDFFPDVEAAEAALLEPDRLHVGIAHIALTDRAFERTPAAVLCNRPVTDAELSAYREWMQRGAGEISDRSIIQMLGIR